jgi:ABC-type transporter Mla subunit MlaD
LPNLLERKRRLLVGWLVLVSLALVVVALSWLKSEITFPGNEEIYFIQFDRVNGLKVGDPVEIRGWKVGQVVGLQAASAGIAVQIKITEAINLPVGSTARLVQAELFGAKRIELILGIGSQNISSGSSILGKAAPDLSNAIELVGELLSRIPPDSVALLLEDLRGAARGANQLLQDEKVKKINLILNQVSTLLEDVSAIAHQFRNKQLSDRLASTLDLTKDRIYKAGGLIDSTRQVVQELRQLVPTAERTLLRGDTALMQLNRTLRQLDQPGTIANKFLQDTAFGGQVDTTLSKLNQTLDFVRQQAIQVRVQLFNLRRAEETERRLRR